MLLAEASSSALPRRPGHASVAIRRKSLSSLAAATLVCSRTTTRSFHTDPRRSSPTHMGATAMIRSEVTKRPTSTSITVNPDVRSP